MAVTVQYEFAKGLNQVTDPHQAGDGFCFVADNVDLRQGSLRAYRMPTVFKDVPTGTTRCWEYRGTWYFSPLHRDYAAEYVGNQERVFFTELGINHKQPREVIDGVEANLGTVVPHRPLVVTEGPSITPGTVTATFQAGGSLSAGAYTYRVAAKLSDGSILPASNAVTGTVPSGSSGSISIAWSSVENASNYVIFGRKEGEERKITEVDKSTLSFLDSGALGLGSIRATNFDPIEGYTYFYTFVRDVNGFMDESGPSPLVGPVNTNLARILARDQENEGLFTPTKTFTNPSTTVTTAASTQTRQYLVGIVGYVGQGKTAFISEVDHALTTGQYAYVEGLGAALDKTYKVTVPSALIAPTSITITQETGSLATGTYDATVYAVRGYLYGGSEKSRFVMGRIASGPASTTVSTVVSTTGKGIRVNWSKVEGADGYVVDIRKDSAAWTRVATNNTEFTHRNDGTDVASLFQGTEPLNIGTSSTRVFEVSGAEYVPPSFTITTTPTFSSSYAWYANPTTTVQLGAAHGITVAQTQSVKQAVFAAAGMNGFFTATATTTNNYTVPVYTSVSETSTTDARKVVIGSGDEKFYKFWRIYRTGDTTEYLRVAEVDINASTFTDNVSIDNLGGNPSSFYTDNGVTVIFEPPPNDLHGIVDHYGMKFGIVGNTVRWTPIGQPNAWPEVFSIPFSFPPVRLISYASFMVVLCPDRPYIINGFEPTAMTRSTTLSNDGCVAPFSAQLVNNVLVYLAARGLVMFNGQDTVCITDRKLIGQFFTTGSTMATVQNFWWLPSESTANYAHAEEQWTRYGYAGIPASNGVALNWGGAPFPGPITSIRSFIHNGKYYLFWADVDSNKSFAGHTTVVVDFAVEGFPVTTMGIKMLDAHVDAFERPYVLLPTGTSTIPGPVPETYLWVSDSSVPQTGTAFGAGLYVAVGAGVIKTSPDGATWTTRTNPVGGTDAMDVCYTGTRFVAITAATPSKTIRSTDGITWTVGGDLPGGISGLRLSFGNNLLVAVGDGVWTSADEGLNWTLRTSDLPFNDAIYNSTLGLWAIGGNYGSRVRTSPDGITWTDRTISPLQGISTMLSEGSVMLAVSSDGGTNKVFRTTNGTTWTQQTVPAGAWRAGTSSSSRFTISGDANAAAVSMDAGVTWSTLTASPSGAWKHAVFGNNKHVTVGAYSG